jgi:hypothetical protein
VTTVTEGCEIGEVRCRQLTFELSPPPLANCGPTARYGTNIMTTLHQIAPIDPDLHPLRLLILTDCEENIGFVAAALRGTESELSFVTVTSPSEFESRLRERNHDVVISDFKLSSWT